MASQNSDAPAKIIKENCDIFGKVLCFFINDSIKSFTFPSCLKEADAITVHKNGKKDKKTIDQSAFYQSYQKYLKELCLHKCLLSLKTFLTNRSAAFVKVITPSNAC